MEQKPKNLDRPSEQKKERPLSDSISESASKRFFPQQFEQSPIVWAIDAFPEEDELNARTAACLQRLFPLAPIHPIYVLSEESFTDRSFYGAKRPELKQLALESVQAFLTQVRLMNLCKPRVLIENSASRISCARKLIKFANRIGAGGIAVGSHGKKGLSRLLIGSFSEALLDHSPLSLLITGPRTTTPRKPIAKIVYPIDFSEESHMAFPEILHLAKYLRAELHLFYKPINILDPMVQSGVNMLGGGWVSVDAYVEPTPEDHRAEAKRWQQRASEEGVHCVFKSENFREPLSDAIVEYVRSLDEASVLISMISHTGNMQAAILGSVTRDVIRQSPCPVYIAGRSYERIGL